MSTWTIFFSGIIWLQSIGLILCHSSDQQTTKSTYDALFKSAVQAYNQERWFECASSMQHALDDHRSYRNSLAQCRSQCRTTSLSNDILFKNLSDVMVYLEFGSNHSECTKDCRQRIFNWGPDRIEDEEVESAFDKLEPYDYLQICAYKSEQYQLAMSAAYTFLSARPNHEYMQNNVEFYRHLPQARPSFFIDLELKPYQVLFYRGVDEYVNENWAEAVRLIEEAVQQYYVRYDQCLDECDAHFETGSFTETYRKVIGSSSLLTRVRLVTELWLRVLQCRTECASNGVRGNKSEPQKDYLAELHNYLQFSYFKLGELRMAAECTATFILLKPGDAVMIHNHDYYSKQIGISAEDFTPRKEARAFFASRNTDSKLLIIAQERLAALSRDLPKNDTMPSAFGPRDRDASMAYLAKNFLSIVEDDTTLEGEHRVAVDGLLSKEQCDALSQLAMKGAEHPAGDMSIYDGLTMNHAAELARDDLISVDQVRVYLNASEITRSFLQNYFKLRIAPLYHSAHLVCRTPDLQQKEQRDFCQTDGSCPEKRPSVDFHRNITVFLYLNDDFENGRLVFSSEDHNSQKSVDPRCGRLVAFESGDSHEIRDPTSGQRCALELGFTFDPNFQDGAHAEAETLLRSLENSKRQQVPNAANLQALLDTKGYRIVLRESDLNGPERFAADDVLTEDQCKQLIKLSNAAGVEGDGYQSQSSPHTKHERFVGLGILNAIQAGSVVGDGYLSAKSSPHTNNEVFEGLGVLRAAELAGSHVSADLVKLYLNVSEASRELVGQYFDKQLYFAFTHLVCRTAIDDKNVNRKDLSHPVHSDNCIMQPDNSCKRERPAYIERDYSGILYLNDDFEGGDFFFAHKDKSIQSSLRPRCGRLVGFNSSNYHGVSAVLSGQRCAVALWFTLDQNFDEQAHAVARRVLTELDEQSLRPKAEL